MSVDTAGRGRLRLIGSAPTNTSITTMLTAGKEMPTVLRIHVCNITDASALCSIAWNDGTTLWPLISNYPIGARDYHQWAYDLPFREAYLLRVTTSVANALVFTALVADVAAGGVKGGPQFVS